MAGRKYAKGFQAWEQGNVAQDSRRIRSRQVRFSQLCQIVGEHVKVRVMESWTS